jgi:hypothetical protein
MDDDLRDIVEGYLEAALFAESDDNGEPLDSDYSLEDFSEEAQQAAQADCEKFVEALKRRTCDSILNEFPNLYEAAVDLNGKRQLGIDLWLTRNHHGSGFWDGDYEGFGDHITHVVAGAFPELCVIVDGNGRLDLECG